METTFVETIKNNLAYSFFSPAPTAVEETQVFESVKGLAEFDMKSIYHHIGFHSLLTLKYNYETPNTHQAVEVFYKQFKLGFIEGEQAKVVEKMLFHGFDLKVKITSIEKCKYLPISGLNIVITDNDLRTF